jgi:hypothetical protein
MGHGKKRQRKMFTDANLNEFIANQTRKAAQCPSTAIRARRSGGSTLNAEVIAFSDRLRRPLGGKRKR